MVGAWLANLMFDRRMFELATKDRITTGHLVGEVVATAGLIALIFALARTGRAALSAAAVGAYIGAAYWFTSSTSFANPAVTIGRIFSDTFAGIDPTSVPGFIAAQIVGALIGLALDRRSVSRRRGHRRRRCRPPRTQPRPYHRRPTELEMTESPAQYAHHHHPDLSIDQQLALRTAATRLNANSTAPSESRPSNGSCTPPTTNSPAAPPSPTSSRCWPNASPANDSPPWPGSKAKSPTANPPCCSCAPTTPDAPRWHSASSPTWPANGRWPGPADRSPATKSTPPQSRQWREVGIDITAEFPKPWTDEIVQAADIVITMGCGDACPIFPGKRYENWDLPDPAGQEVDAVRAIRDDIEQRVRHLLAELNVAAHT